MFLPNDKNAISPVNTMTLRSQYDVADITNSTTVRGGGYCGILSDQPQSDLVLIDGTQLTLVMIDVYVQAFMYEYIL